MCVLYLCTFPGPWSVCPLSFYTLTISCLPWMGRGVYGISIRKPVSRGFRDCSDCGSVVLLALVFPSSGHSRGGSSLTAYPTSYLYMALSDCGAAWSRGFEFRASEARNCALRSPRGLDCLDFLDWFVWGCWVCHRSLDSGLNSWEGGGGTVELKFVALDIQPMSYQP